LPRNKVKSQRVRECPSKTERKARRTEESEEEEEEEEEEASWSHAAANLKSTTSPRGVAIDFDLPPAAALNSCSGSNSSWQ
jgi:hypothetical protein